MDAIWIIIVIIAVIMKFLKVEDFKGKLPEDWEDKKIPPVLKDWGFPWDDEPEPDEELPQKQPVRIKGALSQREEQVTTGADGDSGMNVNPGETQYERAEDLIKPNLKNMETSFAAHPLLNTDTVISGLIMSELLQPPKSKRPGWRNR